MAKRSRFKPLTTALLSGNRIAVLDLGTNTFHLLIVDATADHSFNVAFKSKMVVKLGEGGIHNNLIASKAFNRGMRALNHYASIISKHNVDQVHAFATSAIRSATNGKDFTDLVLQDTGIEISVISGEEEARLICLGVRQCTDIGDEPVLIMDIGGGSTEFIIADRKNIYERHSFNIGAARLLALFKPSDPINLIEVGKVQALLDEELSELDNSMKKYKINHLVGSSGSFDTFAEMIGYKFHGRNVLKNVNSYTFDLNEFLELHKVLLDSTDEDRRGMKGLIKMRVDMIVLASICTEFVLKRYKLHAMSLSKFALKEGALWEIIQATTFKPVTSGIPFSSKPLFVKN